MATKQAGMPTPEQAKQILAEVERQAKVLAPAEWWERADALKSRGKTIVAVAGAWDVVHAGHMDLLSQAKRLGDVLVAGVLTDDAVSRRYGRNRPWVHVIERCVVMSGLELVDFVVCVDSHCQAEIARWLRPTVMAMSTCKRGEELIVGSFPCRVELLTPSEAASTQALIARAKQQGEE
jgi:D-beta-D-heptose 7-phosphate kinase/D-beta-D-heptose 1-phosphate adenosyltransferase